MAGFTWALEVRGNIGFNHQTGIFVAMVGYGGILISYAVRGRFCRCGVDACGPHVINETKPKEHIVKDKPPMEQ